MDTVSDVPVCRLCGSVIADGDNFCRRCGMAVGRAPLPAVRARGEAVVWQPKVPPVVKGAAVMAAGTVGQFLVRRVVGNLVSGAGARKRRTRALVSERDGMLDESQIITETFMVRRVRIRRNV